MRRKYISPEFDYVKVHGTFNMVEESSFFGSKMLEIEDSIMIKDENLVYYQLDNGEQLDLNSESNLPQIVFDTVIEKQTNHRLFLDDAQTEEQKNAEARWILDIELQSILRNYLFATLKTYRTFEGVRNNMTVNNNVNAAIRSYIDNNVLNRYKFSKVEIYYQSADLLTLDGIKYNNQYDASIETPETLLTKFETETDANELDIRIKFYQDKPANRFAFSYYFNLYFEKL